MTNKNIIFAQIVLTIIVVASMGLAALRIENAFYTAWGAKSSLTALAEYCQDLTGSNVWGIEFPSATSTRGIVGCAGPKK